MNFAPQTTTQSKSMDESQKSDRDPFGERMDVEEEASIDEYSSLSFAVCKKMLADTQLFQSLIPTLPNELYHKLFDYSLFTYDMESLSNLLPIGMNHFDIRELKLECFESLTDEWLLQLAYNVLGLEYERYPVFDTMDFSSDDENGFINEEMFEIFSDERLYSCFNGLTCIDLSGCIRLTDYSLLLISIACEDSNLQRLYLNQCPNITGEWDNSLIELPRSLIALSVEGCHKFIPSDLANLHNLLYLNISGISSFNDITLPQLKTLICSSNAFNNEECEQLLKFFPSLEYLDIAACLMITDEIVDVISTMPNLRKINLSRTNLDFDYALQSLVTLENLEHLAFYGNNFAALENAKVEQFRSDRISLNLAPVQLYYSTGLEYLLKTMDEFFYYPDYVTECGSPSNALFICSLAQFTNGMICSY
jgi:hypothetical protein